MWSAGLVSSAGKLWSLRLLSRPERKSKVFWCSTTLKLMCLKRWHGTLLVMFIILFSATFNTLLATRLHLVEGTILVVHIFGFFCVLVPLWVLSPRTSSTVVWTEFSDAGWNNTGLSTLIGIVASVLPLLGADASGEKPSLVFDILQY